MGAAMAIITKQSTIRCRCGRKLSNLKEINDDDGEQKFLTQRCEKCGELNVVRSDGLVMVGH